MNNLLPKELIFSSYAYKRLTSLISRYGKRVYILRGGNSFKDSFWGQDIINSIKDSKLEYLFSKPITFEPDTDIAGELLIEAKAFKPDVVCGIGGGSVMDLAKVVAGLFNESPIDISEYLYSKKIKTKGLKLVLMATTSGSGSEVSSSAVLKDTKRVEKRGIRNKHFKADVAIVDSTLNLTLNRENTLYSSLDAFTHAIESYVSVDSDIASAVLAKRAGYLIYNNLAKTLVEPYNVGLRKRLALASLLAGLSFSQSGLGLAHALSHPIGAIYDIPHGLINGVILPYVIEFNYSVVQERYDDLIFDKKYKSMYNLLKAWFKSLAVPSSFKELGLKMDSSLREKIVTSTLNSGVLRYNPKTPKREDLNCILDKLWKS